MSKIDKRLLDILETKNAVNIRLYVKYCYFFEYEKLDLNTNDLVKLSEFVNIIIDTISYQTKGCNDILNSYLKLYEKYKDEKMKPTVTSLLERFEILNFKFNTYFIDKFNEDINNPILVLCFCNEISMNYILEHHLFSNEFLDKVLCYHYDKLSFSIENFARFKKLPEFVTKIMDDSKRMTNENETIFLEIFEDDNIKLFEKFIEKTNHELSISNLVSACCSKSVKIIKYILSRKIIPDKECFENVLFDNNSKGVEQQQQLVNLLIEHGYTPTYDDIVTVTKLKIEIDKFDEFDFTEQDNGELLRICIENKFTPKYYSKLKLSKSDFEIDEGLTVLNLKRYIEKGYKPDIECLRNACKYCSDKVVSYMLDLKIKPDLECLKNIIYKSGNSTIKSIFDKLVGSIEINDKKKEKLDIELLEIPEDFSKRKIIKLNKKLDDTNLFDKKKNKFSFNQIKDMITTDMETCDLWHDEDSELSLDNERMYQLINYDKKKIKIPRSKLDNLIYTIIKS
jgi:hypothetical protein